MITYIITRFSILDYNRKCFKMTQKMSYDSYKNYLFSENRLNYKFKSFEMITYPSVMNQTNKNYEWYIYTSIYLPEKYKERLLNLVNDKDKVHCVFVESFSDPKYNQINYENNTDYCTIRLDDDDGLSKNFIYSLQKYKNLKNVIVSHVRGRKVTIYKNKVVKGERVNLPLTAIGLCAINMNIMQCGDHSYLNRKYKILYNLNPDMYLIHCGNFCDSKRKF